MLSISEVLWVRGDPPPPPRRRRDPIISVICYYSFTVLLSMYPQFTETLRPRPDPPTARPTSTLHERISSQRLPAPASEAPAARSCPRERLSRRPRSRRRCISAAPGPRRASPPGRAGAPLLMRHRLYEAILPRVIGVARSSCMAQCWHGRVAWRKLDSAAAKRARSSRLRCRRLGSTERPRPPARRRRPVRGVRRRERTFRCW